MTEEHSQISTTAETVITAISSLLSQCNELNSLPSYEFVDKHRISSDLTSLLLFIKRDPTNVSFISSILDILHCHWKKGFVGFYHQTNTKEFIFEVDWGLSLIKVCSRNTLSLHKLINVDMNADADVNEEEMIVSEKLIQLKRQIETLYESKKSVTVYFKHNVPSALSKYLRYISKDLVITNAIPDPKYPDGIPVGPVLNLDISSLVALVSEFTWSSGIDRDTLLNAKTNNTSLSIQQQKESKSPMLLFWERVFSQAKIVVVNEDVLHWFENGIIRWLGGEKEKNRWREFIDERKGDLAKLIKNFVILKGSETVNVRAERLFKSKRISEHTAKVFATGIWICEQIEEMNSGECHLELTTSEFSNGNVSSTEDEDRKSPFTDTRNCTAEFEFTSKSSISFEQSGKCSQLSNNQKRQTTHTIVPFPVSKPCENTSDFQPKVKNQIPDTLSQFSDNVSNSHSLTQLLHLHSQLQTTSPIVTTISSNLAASTSISNKSLLQNARLNFLIHQERSLCELRTSSTPIPLLASSSM